MTLTEYLSVGRYKSEMEILSNTAIKIYVNGRVMWIENLPSPDPVSTSKRVLIDCKQP